MSSHTLRLSLLGLSLALGACSSDSAALGSNGGGGGVAIPRNGPTGVSQPGAQDFGLFRQIVDAGEIPAPETLDALGFFAEHKLDYPAPACGNELCVHGLLGVRGNLITGSNCTMVQLGMNSPIQVEALQRPPMHLVLAIDVSGSMRGRPIAAVRDGLREMLRHLPASDLVSVVTYSTDALTLVETASVADGTALAALFARLDADGGTNIYDGLFTAFSLAEAHQRPGWQSRVILLSDGVATVGIADRGIMRSLARSYARLGIGLTTIGVGTEFDVGLMRDLGEVGAGNFYFLENPSAVSEVFAEEVKTFLYPIALDVRIALDAGSGYTIRRVYGTKGWSGSPTSGAIELASLFLAGRTEASAPIEGGRRGGGGAVMIELLPRRDLAQSAEPLRVLDVEVEYIDPRTGDTRTQTIAIDTTQLPGDVPAEGLFTDGTVEKGFIMLNIYAGFELALELTRDGDVGAARGVLQNLAGGVERWLADNPDPDIEDDLDYVLRLETNLARVPEATPVSRPPEPFPIGD